MTLQSLSSESVVSLSLGQLIVVIVTLVSAMGVIVAYVRNEQKKEDRLSLVESVQEKQTIQIADLTRTLQSTLQQIALLTQQVKSLAETIDKDHRPPTPTRRSKPTTVS